MPPHYHVEGQTVPLASYDIALVSLAALLTFLTICGIVRSLILNTISPTTPPANSTGPVPETIHDNNTTSIQQRCPDTPVSPVVRFNTSDAREPSLEDNRTTSDMASLTNTTTGTSDSQSLCSTTPGTQATSMTSITASIAVVADEDGEEEDDDGSEEDFHYELKRAQTQSMEVKKGILVSWSTFPSDAFCEKDSLVPGLPSVVISELVSSCKDSATSLFNAILRFYIRPRWELLSSPTQAVTVYNRPRLMVQSTSLTNFPCHLTTPSHNFLSLSLPHPNRLAPSSRSSPCTRATEHRAVKDIYYSVFY
ncbi:hypothetical protein D9758_001086 [Tetrapyrgos nigripes]|uniref:Uncharacterized protein n=1 Tax=Tetrapyrgos nigripes TaxID=182062 RepID=A0A8H5LUS3_9AGAR|nr:hypothetical protein D9758_001086 [Tetrapyrgos nigripes]